MEEYKGWTILRDRNLIVPTTTSRSFSCEWKKIRFHKFESIEHFLTKAMIGKLIYNNMDGLVTEHQYPNADVIDVLQIKRKFPNEIIGYQIETNSFEEKKFDNTNLITIDLRKHPELIDLIKRIKEILEDYVV